MSDKRMSSPNTNEKTSF